MLLFLGLALSPFLSHAGDFTGDVGITFPMSTPTGDFTDTLDFSPTIGTRLGGWYTFDMGLILGYESYSLNFQTEEEEAEAFRRDEQSNLAITPAYTFVGWAYDGAFRYMILFGWDQQAMVSTRTSLFSGEADDRDFAAASGAALLVGFGGDEMGLLAGLRYDTLETDDLFGTDKDFKYAGLSTETSIRWRW